MRRLVTLVTLTALPATLALLGWAAQPAAAATPGTGQLSSQAGTIFSTGCYGHTYDYTVQIPSGTEYWQLDVTNVRPDGRTDVTDQVLSGAGTPTSGRRSIDICSTEPAGTWKLTAVLRTCDLTSSGGYSNCAYTQLAPVSYEMSAASASIDVRPRTTDPRPGRRVPVAVTVREQGPSGLRATRFTDVVLQQRKGTRWARVDRGSTDGAGKVTLRAPYAGGRVDLRVVLKPSRPLTGTVSRTVTLR